jgi:hypothetical protein
MKILLGLLSLLFLYSCHCDDLLCPALDTRYAGWINNAQGDTIRFINSAGSRIRFVVIRREISGNKESDCNNVSGYGCKCNDCDATGLMEAVSDSSRVVIHPNPNVTTIVKNLNTFIATAYTANGSSYTDTSTTLSYSIFDHANTINFNPEVVINPGDTFLPSVVLGSKTHSDVIVHLVDTIQYPNQHVWKTYFNKQSGMVGFHDRRTNSLFYRE